MVAAIEDETAAVIGRGLSRADLHKLTEQHIHDRMDEVLAIRGADGFVGVVALAFIRCLTLRWAPQF